MRLPLLRGGDSTSLRSVAWPTETASAARCRDTHLETAGVCRRLEATIAQLFPAALQERQREAQEHAEAQQWAEQAAPPAERQPGQTAARWRQLAEDILQSPEQQVAGAMQLDLAPQDLRPSAAAAAEPRVPATEQLRRSSDLLQSPERLPWAQLAPAPQHLQFGAGAVVGLRTPTASAAGRVALAAAATSVERLPYGEPCMHMLSLTS